MWKTAVDASKPGNATRRPPHGTDRGDNQSAVWQANEGKSMGTFQNPSDATNHAETDFGMSARDSTGIRNLQSAAASAFFGFENVDPAWSYMRTPRCSSRKASWVYQNTDSPSPTFQGGGHLPWVSQREELKDIGAYCSESNLQSIGHIIYSRHLLSDI